MRPTTRLDLPPRSRLRPRSRSLTFPAGLIRGLPHVTLLFVLALLVWIGLRQLATPAVVPALAPATEFSAERAMNDLAVIASEPRAIGSPGHVATRNYLIEQLRALGLDPQIQTTSVVLPSEADGEGFGAAMVQNVVARIPGAQSTGAIAIDAHYDSGSTGPGAGDNGSAVATVLESIRALLAGPALRNDVLIVFADGEEVGMMGAAAFNEQHPWAADIRLSVNFEGQGSGGPALLYATGQENDWVVSEFLKVAPNPTASSLLPEISNLAPSARLDCDLGEYTKRGSHGLGFVFAADTPAYHTVRDNVTEINPGSIQQEGGYTLAILRHFGNLDLSDTPRAGDRVFFNILPGVVASYPASWGLPLASLITVLVVGLLVVGLRRALLTAGGLVVGTLAFLVGTLATVAITGALWFAIHSLNTDYQVMLIGSYQTNLYVIAFIAAAVALMTAMYTVLGRRMRRHNLIGGVLIGWTMLLWLLSLAAPGMSYLAAWPLLFGTLPFAWALLAGRHSSNPWWNVAILSVAAAPAIALLPGTLYQMVALFNRIEGISGLPVLGIAMIFVAPLIGLFVPHLSVLAGGPTEQTTRRRWLVPATAALLALVLIGWGNATSGFDARHPRPDRIAYALNADTGTAQWVSLDQHLDRWTGQFFPENPTRTDYHQLLRGTSPAFTAPAPTASIEAPTATIVSDTTDGELRTLRLRIASPRPLAQLSAEVRAQGEIVAAELDGRALALDNDNAARAGRLRLFFANVPPSGWDLTLSVRSFEPINLVIEDVADGLPAIPGLTIQPRPSDTMPAPGYPRDGTIVTKPFIFPPEGDG